MLLIQLVASALPYPEGQAYTPSEALLPPVHDSRSAPAHHCGVLGRSRHAHTLAEEAFRTGHTSTMDALVRCAS